MGLGAGTVYIPSVAVISHYFQKKRALAMTIVAAGSSLGSVIHPIMLNNTMFGSLGFANSVRASAGLVSGMLLIACCLMHPRLPPPKKSLGFLPAIKKFSRDPAYIFGTLGYVVSDTVVAVEIHRHGLACLSSPLATTSRSSTFSSMPPDMALVRPSLSTR